MAEIVPDVSKLQFTNYNGKQVRTGDDFKAELESGAANWNKTTGQNLTAEQYDRRINGDEAGARWGATAGTPGAYTPPAAPGSAGGSPPGSAVGGLLSSTVPNATATKAEASTYTPTMQNVSTNSLVQNQLATIADKDSALNKLAATDAVKAANRRGLLNSSIAVGSAQKAVLQNALPIAQQDAGTYANKDQADAQYQNSSDQFNAGQKTAVSQTNAQLGTQASLSNQNASLQQKLAAIQADTTLSAADKQIKSQQLIAENENKSKLQLQQMNSDTQKAIAGLDAATKTKLADMDSASKQLLQTNISAANSYAQLAQALQNISTSANMDQTAKQAAVDNQIALFRQNLQAIGKVSGLDLSQYFQQA